MKSGGETHKFANRILGGVVEVGWGGGLIMKIQIYKSIYDTNIANEKWKVDRP